MRPRGGVIGANVTPSRTAAGGIWHVREAEAYKRARSWPEVRSLLQTYADAAAAYSLTYLLPSYTGPVVRVRRSSDNSEQDFYPGQVYDGSLLAFVGGGNGFVRTWYNQVGSAHLVQASTSSQPQIVSSGTLVLSNGNPGIDFGISATPPVELTAALASTNSNWFAVCVVNYKSKQAIGVQASGATDYQWLYGRWISVGTPGTPDYTNTQSMLGFVTTQASFGETPPAAQTGYNNLFAGKSISYDKQYILTSYKSGSTVTTRVNNVNGETITQSGTLNATSLRVGANITFMSEGNSNLWGIVSELIYFQTDHASDVSDINSQINSWYGAY